MRTVRIIAVAAAAFSLVGCATGIDEIPYDHAAAGPVKSIAIMTPDFPTQPAAALLSSVGQSFGLVGLLIDEGMNQNRMDRLQDVLAKQNFVAQQVFLDRLTSDLQAEGYVASVLPAQRPQRGKFLAAYPPAADAKVDAYLDLIIGDYGYYAAGIGDATPYRPFFSIRARLVRARDLTVLMQDTVIYNPYDPTGGRGFGQRPMKDVTIPPEPAAQFVTFAKLEADPAGTVRWLRDAEEKGADTLAGLLR